MIRFRGDVEGLRAVAVMLVVLWHLDVPGFDGGFFGVDVFFVISGYLITSLLAAEFAKKDADGGRGSISIRGFYARRARRILPAALTAIAAVIVAGGLLLNELRVAQIRHDAVWTVLFGSNVNFMQEATNYFAQGLVERSPYQHYWSLAVEEQFYLVWPVLFLVVARLTFLGAAVRWRARVATAAAVIGVASLAWSVVATKHEPAGAYFSTFTRAWELALGALIGIATTNGTALPRRVARMLSVAGAGLLLASCAVIDDTRAFPGAAALLPTTATALLILGGLTLRAPLPNRALSLAPLRFVGRISYSVYLWHWPLIVFTAALYPTMSETVQARILLLLITLGVATLSFYLVERPGRRIGVQIRTRHVPSRPRWRGGNLAKAAIGACVLVAVFVGPLSAINREQSAGVTVASAAVLANATRSDPVVITFARKANRNGSYTSAVRRWQRVIRAGLSLRQLPASLQPLSPHLDAAYPPPCIRGLRGVSAAECVVGNPRAKHVAVLNGDSHAEMLRNTVWRAFDRKKWQIHIFARDGCGWAGSLERGPLSAETCARLQAEALRRIRTLRPDVLLLSEHLVVAPFRSRADIASSLAAFKRVVPKTIVLGHTPLPRPWSDCLVGIDITGCFATLDTTFRSDRHVEQQLTARARATFVDTSAWLCFRGVCPPVIAGVPAYKDETHISAEYQLKLIPMMRALLRSAGVTKNARPA